MELNGNILKGAFTLFKMKVRGEINWLLIKKKDQYSQAKWTLQKVLTDKKQNILRERKPLCDIH